MKEVIYMQLLYGRGRDTPDVSSSEPLWVNNCGAYIDWQKNKRTLRQQGREDWQLILITEGRGFFTVDGETVELPKNTAVLYSPHMRQEYRFFCADRPSFWWVHFSGELAGRLCEGIHRADGELSFTAVDDVHSMLGVFGRMHEHMSLGEAVSERYLCGLLCEMFGILESEKKRRERCTDEEMEAVRAYMQVRFKDRLTVDDCAKTAGMSKYHFIRRFTAYTKKTPIEYLTELRIHVAKDLLCSEELSVGECAELVGYSDRFYFCRVFKKHTGLSPAQYRKNCRN